MYMSSNLVFEAIGSSFQGISDLFSKSLQIHHLREGIQSVTEHKVGERMKN